MRVMWQCTVTFNLEVRWNKYRKKFSWSSIQ